MEDKELHNLQRRLRETRELAERNHDLLEKIYRSIVWSRIFRVIYWVVLIGIAIGAFYFLEPYFQNVMGSFDAFRDGGFSSFLE